MSVSVCLLVCVCVCVCVYREGSDSSGSVCIILEQGQPAVSMKMMKPSATGRLKPLRVNLTDFTHLMDRTTQNFGV